MQVSDPSSNRKDQIANFAEILRKAPTRQKIFEAIYFGKKKQKTIEEVAERCRMTTKQVANVAHDLAVGHRLFDQDKISINGRPHTVYAKIEFIKTNRRIILDLARDNNKLGNYHTKSNPVRGSRDIKVTITTPFKINVKQVWIDDIDELDKVRSIKRNSYDKHNRLREDVVKNGLSRLFGLGDTQKDWGGEMNDMLCPITIKGEKVGAAFALKGPGKSGDLVPGKMGKNGDQIQRLFGSPAVAFFVQYEGNVAESVKTLMTQLATAKSIISGTVYWGIIDGEDTSRLRKAYPIIFR